MTAGSYDAFDDPYAYPGTQVLKNRLGTRDPAVLQAFEVEMTTLRAREPLPAGRFGSTHYCRVHRHLFQDVYAWAGQYRTVRTSKSGNVFCYPENIEGEMNRLFGRLKRGPFARHNAFGAFVAGAAAFLADLNAIHPFRDGNGRAQLAFLHLVAVRARHPFRLEMVEPENFLRATVASFAGDLKPLVAELAALRTSRANLL